MSCNADNCNEITRSSMFAVHPESECGSHIIWQRRSCGLVVSKIFQEEQKRKEDERQKAVAEKKRLQEICFQVSHKQQSLDDLDFAVFPPPCDPFYFTSPPLSLSRHLRLDHLHTENRRTQTHRHKDSHTHTHTLYTHLRSPTHVIDINANFGTLCGLYEIGEVGGFPLSSRKVSVFFPGY